MLEPQRVSAEPPTKLVSVLRPACAVCLDSFQPTLLGAPKRDNNDDVDVDGSSGSSSSAVGFNIRHVPRSPEWVTLEVAAASGTYPSSQSDE
jgi:hypothetical protein